MQGKWLMKPTEASEYIGGGAIPAVRVGSRHYIARAVLDPVLEQSAKGEWMEGA